MIEVVERVTNKHISTFITQQIYFNIIIRCKNITILDILLKSLQKFDDPVFSLNSEISCINELIHYSADHVKSIVETSDSESWLCANKYYYTNFITKLIPLSILHRQNTKYDIKFHILNKRYIRSKRKHDSTSRLPTNPLIRYIGDKTSNEIIFIKKNLINYEDNKIKNTLLYNTYLKRFR